MAKSNSPSRVNRALRKSQRCKPSGIGRNRPIPAKRPTLTIPAPQRARILARHVAGQSIRGIARAENRDRETVAKVLRAGSGEVDAYVAGVNEGIRDLAGTALNSLGLALERNGSGWLALRILEALNVFPDARERRPAVVQQPTAAEIKEAKTKAFFAHFAKEAYERSRAFDAPLVDIEADLHTGVAQSNGTVAGNEQRGTENDTPSPAARRSIFDFRDED